METFDYHPPKNAHHLLSQIQNNSLNSSNSTKNDLTTSSTKSSSFGNLVPYRVPSNEENPSKTITLANSDHLYGFEPGKWLARARKSRISRSNKPIEVIRKKRLYLRHYNHDMLVPPKDARHIFKYCTNACMDVTYRFAYPSASNKVSISKEYLIHSPLVTHVEFFIDSYSNKDTRQVVIHQLRKLKRVKNCFILLGSLRNLNFLNTWRGLDSLRIKCGMEWTLVHWYHLSQVIKPNISCLSLNIRLMIESIKGQEYIQCLEKIHLSSIETLNLKLELQSEYIIDYLFIRCLCMSKVKNLHLRCIGNTVMTDHGVLTYEFQGLLNHLIPRSLSNMESLIKLKLDFSNDFFVYYRMEDYQLVELCQAIQELPQLILLDLNISNGCERANQVADSTLMYLEESISKLERLQVLRLNVSNTFITDKGLEKLCKFAMCLENLHYFRINASRNGIDKRRLEEALFNIRDQIVIYCDIIV